MKQIHLGFKTKLILLFALTVACSASYYYLSNYKATKTYSSNNIVFITIPKSASTYILNTLTDSLDYTPMRITEKYDDTKPILEGNFNDFFAKDKRIVKAHFRAPNTNPSANLGPAEIDFKTLAKHTNKIVLHLRDPRQVLLSYIHYVNLYKEKAYVLPERPPEFYTWELSRQIDWGIDNMLPRIVTWMEDWLKFKDQVDSNNYNFKILVTTYDEMINNQDLLFAKILAFYKIPSEFFQFKAAQKNVVNNFRKGDPEEWRTAFNDKQKQRVSELVPKNLLIRFNWQP